MYKYFIRIIIAILIIIFCFACEDTSIVSQRYKKSKKGRDNITIAVAGSWDKINYRVDMLNAVALAVEEINSTNMLNGRKIVLIAKHDSADINKARLIATEIANNTDVVAVIGHSLSFITSSVDDIYSIGGLLMLSPSLYIPDKIKKTIPMMFSYTPNPDSIAETFIRYMKSKNYKSAAVAYLNEDSSIKILNSFYNIGDNKIKIIDSISFNITDMLTFSHIVGKWTDLEFDAIIFIAPHYYYNMFIPVLEQYNMKKPVLVVSQPDIALSQSNKNQNTSDAVFFHTCNFDNKTDELEAFETKFNNKYGHFPGHIAIDAYDSMRLLAEAYRGAATAEPLKAAQEIRKIINYKGLCGTYNFNDSGLIEYKEIYLLKIIDGKNEYIKNL